MKKAFLALVVTLASMSFAMAQSAPSHFLSLATTNCTLIQTGKTVLHDLIPINTTTTLYYLKLFNKATQPVAGTDVPVWTIPIPFGASNAGGGLVDPSTMGVVFQAGLGFCLTGAIADLDTTPAATGVVINIGTSAN
jgi:hypothetical protein